MRTAALLCLLVVLAGCVGPGTGGTSTTPTDDPTPVPHSTSDTATTPARTPAPTTPALDASDSSSNPWDASPVTVEVIAPGNDSREYRWLVRRALDFWENESTGYDLSYRITDDDADVTVRFVATVTGCNGEPDRRDVGCATYIPRGGTAYGETLVRVETGYTNASTLATLKHEFGHTLGYDHDDADVYGFMEAVSTQTRLPAPNATSLANPWQDDSLSVYADYPDVIDSQRSEYEAAVERAVAFYRTDDRSTLPPGVDLDLTSNRSAADIVIEFSGTGTSRSVGERHGYDEDADGALERFTRYEIRVNSIERDRVAWHVGYWLGWAFGAASHEELPAPFDEPDEDDRENW